MADGTKAPKGALIAGLVFILLAFGGCGYGCVSGAGFFGDVADAIEAADATAMNTPTSLRATGEGALILTGDDRAICLVSDESGADVKLDDPGAASGTLEVNGESLQLAFTFETTAGTTYDVICGDEAGTLTGNYAVAGIPELSKLGTAATGIGAGVVLFLIGVLLLIVGLIQRSRWKKRQTQFGGPSAGGPVPPPPGGSVPPPPGGSVPPPPGGSVPPPPGGAAPMAPPPPGAASPVPPPPGQPPVPPAQPPAPPSAPPPMSQPPAASPPPPPPGSAGPDEPPAPS